jgi:hypothetical protein
MAHSLPEQHCGIHRKPLTASRRLFGIDGETRQEVRPDKALHALNARQDEPAAWRAQGLVQRRAGFRGLIAQKSKTNNRTAGRPLAATMQPS